MTPEPPPRVLAFGASMSLKTMLSNRGFRLIIFSACFGIPTAILMLAMTEALYVTMGYFWSTQLFEFSLSLMPLYHSINAFRGSSYNAHNSRNKCNKQTNPNNKKQCRRSFKNNAIIYMNIRTLIMSQYFE